MSFLPNSRQFPDRRIRTAILFVFIFSGCLSAVADPAPYEGYRKIETDHFVIIFEPAFSAAAEHVAGIAENAYNKITSFYGSYPDTIHCVVDGRANMYGSYYSPLPAHIHISLYGPTWPMFSPRNDDWLELVFVHELTHYVQLNYESGVFHALSLVFGPGLHAVPGAFLPTWAVEGPGVLTETLFTSGGRGDSEHFEGLSKAVADEFFDICRAGSTTVFEPAQRPYLAGHLISEHILRVYGNDALKDIHREFVRFPFLGPGRAIRRVTGTSIRSIFADVAEEVKPTASAQRRYQESARITPKVYGDYYLPQPTDRGWITYRHTHDLPAALVFFNPDTGDEEVLVTTGLTDPSSFSADPSGSTVVYTSNISTKTAAGRAVYSDLFILSTESRQERRITRHERLWHPAINPADGSIVAVTGSGNESCLVIIDRQTGELEVLFKKTASTIYNPVFSEDGRDLYFTMNIDGMQDIWVLPYPLQSKSYQALGKPGEINSSAARPVTGPDRAGEFLPRISNGRLVYASDRSGDLAVYAKAPGDGPGVLLAEDPVGAYAGFLEGNEVVYTAYTETGYALKRAVLSGSAVEALAGGSKPHVPRDQGNYENSLRTGNSGSPAQSVFFDLPRLLFWIPIPFSLSLGENSIDIGSGAGVYAVAGSILRTNMVSATIMFNWFQIEPVFDITGTFGYRKAAFGYDLSYSHEIDTVGNTVRDFDAQISLAYPLIEQRRFPHRQDLRVYGGLGFSAQSAPALYGSSAGAGLACTTARSGAQKDFFDPLRFSVWTAATVDVPFSQFEHPAATIGTGAYVQVPSIIGHQVTGIGMDARYGPFWIQDSAEVFHITAALDYRFHIALLDLPLPYGYSLNHLAGGVYIETRASAGNSHFMLDKHLYPGFEIITNFGAVNHIPVGIGVRFSVNPRSITTFNLLTDSYVYLTSGRGGFENRPAALPHP